MAGLTFDEVGARLRERVMHQLEQIYKRSSMAKASVSRHRDHQELLSLLMPEVRQTDTIWVPRSGRHISSLQVFSSVLQA